MNDQDECVSKNERHHIPKQPLQYSCMNAYVFSIITMQFFFVAMITPETSPTGQTHFPTISFSFPFLFNGFRNTRFEFFTNDFASKKKQHNLHKQTYLRNQFCLQ